MNFTSRDILQTVLATSISLSVTERSATRHLMDGQVEALATVAGGADELLSVSRATIWRMTKDCMLHPVEILPRTWR